MPKSPRIPPDRSRRIELFAFPRVQILDVTGPLQVFATANDIVGKEPPPYLIDIVSQGGGNLASSAGVTLIAQALPLPDLTLDTLIIAGGPGVEAAAADAALVRWIGRRSLQARR